MLMNNTLNYSVCTFLNILIYEKKKKAIHHEASTSLAMLVQED